MESVSNAVPAENVPPEYWWIIGVIFLAGIVSYSLTEAIKLFLGNWLDRKGDIPDPWWWQGLFRLTPMLLGFLLGWPVLGLAWGGLSGVVGGIFSVALYKKVSAWIEEMKSPLNRAG